MNRNQKLKPVVWIPSPRQHTAQNTVVFSRESRIPETDHPGT